MDSPKAQVTMTFGLTANNMQVIEAHINKWDGAVFDRRTWEKIGEEIGWDHLTAALWYFRKLERKKEGLLQNTFTQELQKDLEKELQEFTILPENVLAHAYDLLMDGYGKHFPPHFKAQDFQSFLREGQRPACKMSSWINAIDYLRGSLERNPERGIESEATNV